MHTVQITTPQGKVVHTMYLFDIVTLVSLLFSHLSQLTALSLLLVEDPESQIMYKQCDFHKSRVCVCVCVIIQVPGAVEYGITSDDLFFMQKPPGKTLVYIILLPHHLLFSLLLSLDWLLEEAVSKYYYFMN